MKKFLAPFVVFSLVIAACGNGQDEQEVSRVRQAAFGEPGGEIGKRLDREVSVNQYAMPDQLVQISKAPEPLYPSEELLEILAWLEKGVGRIPVMLQLPVAWTPEGVLAGGQISLNQERYANKGPESVELRVQLSVHCFSNRDYAKSSIDLNEFERMYLEWQGNENRLQKARGLQSSLKEERTKNFVRLGVSTKPHGDKIERKLA